MKPCPCHSKKPYAECCEPYHKGKAAEHALILMRSRYAAYALGLTDYIIATTHPENPQALKDQTAWESQILEFSHKTQFQNLEILETQEKPPLAFVTFKASLRQNDQDASFTETSEFEIWHGKWTYKKYLQFS